MPAYNPGGALAIGDALGPPPPPRRRRWSRRFFRAGSASPPMPSPLIFFGFPEGFLPIRYFPSARPSGRFVIALRDAPEAHFPSSRLASRNRMPRRRSPMARVPPRSRFEDGIVCAGKWRGSTVFVCSCEFCFWTVRRTSGGPWPSVSASTESRSTRPPTCVKPSVSSTPRLSTQWSSTSSSRAPTWTSSPSCVDGYRAAKSWSATPTKRSWTRRASPITARRWSFAYLSAPRISSSACTARVTARSDQRKSPRTHPGALYAASRTDDQPPSASVEARAISPKKPGTIPRISVPIAASARATPMARRGAGSSPTDGSRSRMYM